MVAPMFDGSYVMIGDGNWFLFDNDYEDNWTDESGWQFIDAYGNTATVHTTHKDGNEWWYINDEDGLFNLKKKGQTYIFMDNEWVPINVIKEDDGLGGDKWTLYFEDTETEVFIENNVIYLFLDEELYWNPTMETERVKWRYEFHNGYWIKVSYEIVTGD